MIFMEYSIYETEYYAFGGTSSAMIAAISKEHISSTLKSHLFENIPHLEEDIKKLNLSFPKIRDSRNTGFKAHKEGVIGPSDLGEKIRNEILLLKILSKNGSLADATI